MSPTVTPTRYLVAVATIAWLVVVLCIVGLRIRAKEVTIADGHHVLLRLAPVDPRSLMQGDYMVLRYAVAEATAEQWRQRRDRGEIPRKGLLILRPTPSGDWEIPGLYEGESSFQAGDILLHYRYRGDRIDLGAESFFFPEGAAETYESARYGELRVDAEGNAVLIGLAGEDREPLGQSLHE